MSKACVQRSPLPLAFQQQLTCAVIFAPAASTATTCGRRGVVRPLLKNTATTAGRDDGNVCTLSAVWQASCNKRQYLHSSPSDEVVLGSAAYSISKRYLITTQLDRDKPE